MKNFFKISIEGSLIKLIFFGKNFKVNLKNWKSNKRFLIKIDRTSDIINDKITQLSQSLYSVMENVISISNLHTKTFSEFKNINKDKTVFLFGAGPSVNQFVPFIQDAVYVGLNRAFKFDKVLFDYLFTIDKEGLRQYWDEFCEYRKENCIKFIGMQELENIAIPESQFLKCSNAKKYITTINKINDRFVLDIESRAIGNFATVSLQAMQFILYTNPQKIYLVGIDCTAGKNRHFIGESYDNSKRGENIDELCAISIRQWKELKKFASIYYPDTEIISVNPVGLKGLFKDVYL